MYRAVCDQKEPGQGNGSSSQRAIADLGTPMVIEGEDSFDKVVITCHISLTKCCQPWGELP